MSKVNAVIWDIGNVLVRWDPRYLYRGMFESDAAMEDFLANVTTAEWNLAQDEGRTFTEAVEILSAKYPEHADMIALYDTNWIETVGGEIAGSVKMLNTMVNSGTVVYGLTNFSAEKWPIFCEHYKFTGLFQDVIVSGIEKLIKPDPRIYELAIRRFDIEPTSTLFIDDRPENVQAAEAQGMIGHHFVSAEALKTDLQAKQVL